MDFATGFALVRRAASRERQVVAGPGRIARSTLEEVSGIDYGDLVPIRSAFQMTRGEQPAQRFTNSLGLKARGAIDHGGDGASIVGQNQHLELRGGERGARRAQFRLALRGEHQDIFVDYGQRFFASHAVILGATVNAPEGVFPAASDA
jgi:hypothetical protein